MVSPGAAILPPRRHLTALPSPTPDVAITEPLPRYRTSFVGREAELRSVAQHLADPACRVVTIVGRSGVGKTRLAVEAGRLPIAAERGGVAMVELGQIADASQVAALVATSIGTDRVPGQAAEEVLRRRFRHSSVVLIVDDIDVARGAAQVVVDLVSQSPRSIILATAQRATGLPGERVVRLDPLEVPARTLTDPARLMANPAVTLYADRAAALDPAFRLTEANVGDVAELARRLDGLPLAIELGASRARILPPHAQVAALDEHSTLDLRAGRNDSRPERHRDLRSAVAASYAVASPAAQTMLRRASVAAGTVTSGRVRDLVAESGWTLADILDGLGELVDLGLTDVEPGVDGEPLFRLHSTVAAYGRERLAADDDAAAAERRYDDAIRALARSTRSAPHRRRLDVLADASAELHVVFARLAARSRDDPARAEDALQLAADLGPHWAQRGLFQGPGSNFEELLESAETGRIPSDPATLARALLWWCRLVVHGVTPSQHRATVITRLARAAELARATGDEALQLFTLECVVWCVFVTGDMPGAFAATPEGLALAQRLGDREAVRRFEYTMAMVADLQGDQASAVRFGAPALESALRAHDLIDTIRVSSVLWRIPPGTPGLPTSVPSAAALLRACLEAGEVVEADYLYAVLVAHAVAEGSVGDAARWAGLGLELAQQLGAWYASGMITVALVLVANTEGDDAVVAMLHGSLTPVLPEASVGMAPYAALYDAAVVGSRDQFGAAAFDQLAADGAVLDRDAAAERAVDYAQAVLARSGASSVRAVPDLPRGLAVVRAETPDRPEHLTPRELDVLRALMTGATNGVIAKTLGLRPKTVMHHSVSIYAKLGVRGRTEATAWAYRNGIETGSIAEPSRAAS